jgi:hypothetical protein
MANHNNQNQGRAIGVPNIPIAPAKDNTPTSAAVQVMHGGFQSEAALNKARADSAIPEEDTSEPQPAISSPVVPPQIVAVDQSHYNRMVKIRPRVSIPRTRIGNDWYSFAANKDCLVPAHVRLHLEEKGIL